MQNLSPPASLLHLSQSECSDWIGCAARAWARYVLGVRPPDDEDRPRRVGSMGHAIVVDSLRARWWNFDPDPRGACEEEAARRKWSGIDEEEFSCACLAADLVRRELNLDTVDVLPDLYSDTESGGSRGPLAEVRLRVGWDALISFFRDGSHMSTLWRDIMRCEAVRHRFAGIEGQPDLVIMPEGPGGPVVVVDYKFRQKPDLGGASDPSSAAQAVPDRQAAWYLALLHAVGLRPAGGIEFWQVNAYAGRWLTVDDFLAAADGRAQTVEQYELVTERGLPTRDLSRMADAGGLVTAEVWAEAHRLLADARLTRRLDDWRTPKYTPKGNLRKQGDPPDRLSSAESEDARRFIAEREAYRPVVVRKFRADPIVCREVIRDMIVGVDAPLAQALRGVTPGRNIQNYRTAPCVVPGKCAIRVPCMASLGAGDLQGALSDFVAQGALVRNTGPLGVAPAGLRGADGNPDTIIPF